MPGPYKKTVWHEIASLIIRILRWLGSNPKKINQHCVCPPALKKPDPFLYCQYYLISLGIPVTWDNPDIYIFDGNVPVDPHDLKANTPYTVVARIWNNSPDVPVINLKVNFSYLSFGMGVQTHSIGVTTTDLAAKGLPGCPAFAYMSWTTPATLGHYCIQVLLEPPDDLNWLNNLGQRNTDVVQPQSPAISTFVVGNHEGPRTRTVRFSVDCYTIPPLRPCGETRKRGIETKIPAVPAGWNVALSLSEVQLAPGDEQQVQAEITPPAGFSGSQAFNITGRDENGPVGGVTLTVEVP